MRYLLCTLFATSSFVFHTSPSTSENGPALFSLVPPNKSGIKFNNKLRDTKEDNIMIYSNFYGGAGVGIGDINGDGLQDLYFAGNQVADKLYLNKGGLQFEDITRKAGIKDDGGWSSGVVMADVNQDGLLDIYVTRELYDYKPELRRNKLYINNGDATFSEQAAAFGVDDDQRTRHATFFDYDKDGDLDLFLCNQPPNPGHYSEFLPTELIKPEFTIKLYDYEDGRFTDVTQKAGLQKTGFPNSITASDINGDGWTDLYVANDFWIEDWIFINKGDGTFSNEIYDRVNHISFSSMGVDAADIDNDGDLDMMVVDMVAEDNYRLKANMSGMNPKRFWKVVEDGGHYQYMFNMLFLNQGDGYFSDIAQLCGVANTDWSWSPLIADFDNDGWKDIFVTNGLMRDIRNNDASKEFPDYLEAELFKYIQNNPNPPADITVWDVIDIDEAMELIPSQKLSNYVFHNNGDLTFTKKMEEWGLSEEAFSHGAAYADLDNDGDLDLVVSNVNDPAFLYENHATDANENHYLRVALEADNSSVQTLGAKIEIRTRDGQQFVELTAVRGMYSTSESIAHFGLGNTAFVGSLRVEWPDGKVHSLENVEADQQITVRYSDAAVPGRLPVNLQEPIFREAAEVHSLPHNHVENDFDDYEFQVLLPHKMSTMGPYLTSGDINGDGLEDVFVGGSAGHEGALFLQKDDLTFAVLPSPILKGDAEREDMGSAFFDADNDGDLDLYVVSGGNEWEEGSSQYQDRLYINDGLGSFGSGPDLLPDMTFCGSVVKPYDFDLDGDLDLFVAGRHRARQYPLSARSALLQNENGRFTDVTSQIAPDFLDLGMVNDAAWFDYDSDGLQDLVVVGEWMPVTIFRNTSEGFVKVNSQNLADHTGWFFSVEAADMDGDGDDDLFAGNLGLNYKYKASADEPFEVYYYDFDSNGSKDVVLTYYNFGVQYPLRGRECSSEQVPLIKEKFQNYDLFAASDVSVVYGDDNLKNALHLRAKNFASLYLENIAGSHFEVHTLPTMAQISSINDFYVEDINGDGHLDAILAGNLFDAEVETTRADAGYGLVLLGDGSGNFQVMDKMESGLFIPFQVRSLTSVSCSAGRKLIAGVNGGSLKTYYY